jgi:hypothetical protein
MAASNAGARLEGQRKRFGRTVERSRWATDYLLGGFDH